MKLENIIPIYYFIDVHPFQYNDIFKLKNLLYNNPTISNICEEFYFGQVSFKTKKHDSWDIELFNAFNTNINTIVIKIKEDSICNPKNDKYLVIYQNITKSLNSYGCFWINNDNKIKVMHISIEYVVEDLLQIILKDINLWPKLKLYNAITDRKNKRNAIEMDNIYKEYVETYRCNHYEDWKEMSRRFNARYKI